MGNHDDNPPGSWYTLWNQYLPAQQSLGHNGEDGIYYSVTYGSAVFFMLDSEHVSPAVTNYLDPQTTLARVGAGQAVRAERSTQVHLLSRARVFVLH